MRTLLSVQRSLHRVQKRHIDALLEGASPTFRAYEATYHRHTRNVRGLLPPGALMPRVLEADVVYVGDYHTHAEAQATYLELARRALGGGRPVVLALELIESRFQPVVDAYLRRTVGEAALLRQIGYPFGGDHQIWPSFRSILRLARSRSVEVLAIDRRVLGPRSLHERDAHAAERIAAVAARPSRPLVLVLVGQFHVAPPHLPARVRRQLRPTSRRHLVLYQNAEGAYFSLLRRHTVPRAGQLAELGAGSLCLFTASPAVCQRSFLDYVESSSRTVTGSSSEAETVALLSTALQDLLGAPPARLRRRTPGLIPAASIELPRRRPASRSALDELAARAVQGLTLPRAALPGMERFARALVDPVGSPPSETLDAWARGTMAGAAIRRSLLSG